MMLELLATALVLPWALHAAEGVHTHEHHGLQNRTREDALVTVTINPEARVSAKLSEQLPAPSSCGQVVRIPVKIINQGFVTTRLEAQLTGNVPAGAKLDFAPEPLRGAPEEMRMLRITLTNTASTDLTIAFRAHNESPDLGGRNRIHLVMRCKGN